MMNPFLFYQGRHDLSTRTLFLAKRAADLELDTRSAKQATKGRQRETRKIMDVPINTLLSPSSGVVPMEAILKLCLPGS